MPIDIAGTILEGGRQRAGTLLKLADIAGQGRQQSAAIWGSTLANIGQNVGQMFDPVRLEAAKQSRQTQEINKFKLDEARQAAADEAKARLIVQQLSANGPPDPDDVADAFDQNGLMDYGAKYRTQLQKARADGANAIKTQFENQASALKVAGALYSGVSDDATLQHANRALPTLLPPEMVKFVQAQIGDTYDKTKVDAVLNMGRSEQDRLAIQREAAQAAHQAFLDNKDKATLDETLWKSGALLLSTARTPEEYAHFLETIGQGSKRAASMLPQTFSPEALKQNETIARGLKSGANLQAKDVMMNGRPTTTNYDPEAGTYTPVPGVAPIPPASANKPQLTPYAEANITNRLVTQWTTASKPAVELSRQVELMDDGLEAAKRGNLAQGAQAVLVTFQKILDPNSVVRESEYARSGEGLALLARIKGATERITKGGAGVPLAELQKFADLAREMSKAQSKYRDAVKERIGKNADRYNIPREMIFEDFALPSAGGGPVTIKGPDGKDYTFPNQAAADAALKGAGR